MRKEIMISDVFDGQSHQRCCEKKPGSVFESKRKFFIRCVFVFFHMRKLMKHPTHHQLIEQNDQEDHQKDQKDRKLIR